MTTMRILTVKETCHKIGRGRTKLYELAKTERFPKPVRVDCSVGFIEHEIDQWIASLIAERDGTAKAAA